MPATITAAAMLDREFLEIRCRLIEVAASLDRIHRAPEANTLRGDNRLDIIREAIGILVDGKFDRAERTQMAFSDPHDENWKA